MSKSRKLHKNICSLALLKDKAFYDLALYASSSTAKISSQVETTGYQTITCTRKATLSNGTVRYYGKTGWFTYSCEMDI